jgi:hypothetical protein
VSSVLDVEELILLEHRLQPRQRGGQRRARRARTASRA